MKRLILALAVCGSASAPVLAQAVDPDRMVRPYWWDQPVVEALGRAQMEVEPNRAAFEVTFVETDRDSDDAMALAVARAKVAYDAIEAVAGDVAIVTTSVSVDPYYEQYRDDDRNMVENRRADKVAGYEASVQVSVVVSDITLAGRARAAALALGPQRSERLRVYLEETVEMQRDAMKVAALDARARAEAMVAASGGDLGAMMVIQEGQGPCLGSWSSRQVARQTLGSGPGDSRAYVDRPAPAPMAARERVVVTGALVGRDEITITEADIEALNLPSEQAPLVVHAAVCAVYVLTQ